MCLVWLSECGVPRLTSSARTMPAQQSGCPPGAHRDVGSFPWALQKPGPVLLRIFCLHDDEHNTPITGADLALVRIDTLPHTFLTLSTMLIYRACMPTQAFAKWYLGLSNINSRSAILLGHLIIKALYKELQCNLAYNLSTSIYRMIHASKLIWLLIHTDIQGHQGRELPCTARDPDYNRASLIP